VAARTERDAQDALPERPRAAALEPCRGREMERRTRAELGLVRLGHAGTVACDPAGVEALACQRDRFELPRDVAYLNAAYMGPLAHEVVAAGESGLRAKARPWEIRPADFFSGAEAFREAAARLVG